MLKKFMILSIILILTGCNAYVSDEKVVYYKSDIPESELSFNQIINFCGEDITIKINGDKSTYIHEYISFANCDNVAAFIDYNKKLKEVDIFVDINYKEKYFEVYSYDKKIVDYTETVSELQNKITNIAQVSLKSFEYAVEKTIREMDVKKQEDIERNKKLVEIKNLNNKA